MTRLLVSVRDVREALSAAAAGADFIDLKEPRAGALGGLPVQTIREVVTALRRQGATQPISATIGDWPMAQCEAIVAQVLEVADCGVDYVKVGIENEGCAADVLQALAGCGRPVVPVFIADRGVDGALLAAACALPFPALMLDTADKQAGSLFDCIIDRALRRFIEQVRHAGQLAGLAGALRLQHLPRLRSLAPDFAGFRSAVCSGARTAELVPAKVRALRAELHGGAAIELAHIG
jgi:uncharacterized protein (UPF0264 family)